MPIDVNWSLLTFFLAGVAFDGCTAVGYLQATPTPWIPLRSSTANASAPVVLMARGQVKSEGRLFITGIFTFFVISSMITTSVLYTYVLFLSMLPATEVVTARSIAAPSSRVAASVPDEDILRNPGKLISAMSDLRRLYRLHNHWQPECQLRAVCRIHRDHRFLRHLTRFIKITLRWRLTRWLLGLPAANQETERAGQEFFYSAEMGSGGHPCGGKLPLCSLHNDHR